MAAERLNLNRPISRSSPFQVGVQHTYFFLTLRLLPAPLWHALFPASVPHACLSSPFWIMVRTSCHCQQFAIHGNVEYACAFKLHIYYIPLTAHAGTGTPFIAESFQNKYIVICQWFEISKWFRPFPSPGFLVQSQPEFLYPTAIGRINDHWKNWREGAFQGVQAEKSETRRWFDGSVMDFLMRNIPSNPYI